MHDQRNSTNNDFPPIQQLIDASIQVICSGAAPLPSKVKAVAIDFDLTIVDAEKMHENSIYAALGSLLPASVSELPGEITNELSLCCFGVPESESFQNGAHLIKQKLLLAEIEGAGCDFFQSAISNISADYLASLRADLLNWWMSLIEENSPIAHFKSLQEVGIHPVPYMDGLIRRVNERGVPLAICTNSGEGVVQPIIRALGLKDCFSVGTYAGDPELKAPKPSPDPYLLTFRKLGVDPQVHEIAVFEDSLTGSLSALSAGAHVFVRPSDSEPQTFAKSLKNALMALSPEAKERGTLKSVTVVSCWSQVCFADELTDLRNCSFS